jgi:hypothetical protein
MAKAAIIIKMSVVVLNIVFLINLSCFIIITYFIMNLKGLF